MKYITSFFFAIFVILCGTIPAYGSCTHCSKINLPKIDDFIEFNIMGKQIKVDVAPKIINQTIFLPARATLEHLGYQTGWDSDKKIATFSDSQGHTISIVVGEKNIMVNTNQYPLHYEPIVDKERILITPELVEPLGYWWQWNNNNNILNINKYEWVEK